LKFVADENVDRQIVEYLRKDFGELVYRQCLINPGVILLRMSGLMPTVKAELVVRAISAHMNEMRGSFVVLSHRSIRTRHPKAEKF
jgi:hypothetical protein